MALALIVLLHALAAFFVARLHLNNAPEAYYPSDSPAIVLRDALRREFPSDEVLTVVFSGPSLYEPEVIRRMDVFARDVAGDALVDRVLSVTTIEHIAGSADGFAVGPLVDVTRLGSADETRRRIQADRFAPGLLVSHDGRYLAVAVRPKPLTETSQRVALRNRVFDAIDAAGLRPLFVGDAGPVSVDVAQMESVESDSALFVPLTVGIGIALLWWLVGSVRPVVLGMVAMSTVVGPTIGLVAALGAPYTMVTAILPSLLSAYTLATLMHLYAGIQRAQAGGLDNAAAVRRALADSTKPGLFNVLTTGAGLLSLLLVPIPPIQVFGAAAAFGTVLVFVAVFWLAPSLLLRWDSKPWPRRHSGMGRLGRLAVRVTMFSLRRARAVLVGVVALVLLALPMASSVRVESDLLKYFHQDHPVSRNTELIESRFVGVTTLEIALTGSERDSMQDLARLRAIRELQRWLETQPEVDRTVSMADLVEEMHWAMHDEDPAKRALPDDDRLLRQYLLVYDGRDLYELVNRDFQRARLMVNLNVHGAREIGAVIDKIRRHAEAEPIPGVRLDIGGHGRLFADQADLLVNGQINSFAGAFGQIFLFMALLWRSFKSAALCMVPNLAPLYFIFVLMGATATPLDMATVMIASLVLGITVDDTIHLYYHYREKRLGGTGPVLAIARSFESSGRAVLAISLLLVTQFALLGFSAFIPTSNFGWLTAIGLLAGQAFELLLLPALLLVTAGLRGASGRRASDGAPLASSVALVPGRNDVSAFAPAVQPARSAASVLPVPEHERRVLVCMGDRCRAAGAPAVWREARDAAARLGLEQANPPTRVTECECLGRCESAPLMQALPEGVYWEQVDPRIVQPLLALRPRPNEDDRDD